VVAGFDSEFALRSLSALISVWVVALTYRVTRRLQLSAAVAVGAAAIAAVQPYQIWLAQDAKNMYQLSLIGGLFATLYLPDLLRGQRRAWVLYVISGALAMLSHYYALFGLLAHGVYVLLTNTSWRLRARWVLAGVAMVVTVSPWALIVLPRMGAKQFSLAQSSACRARFSGSDVGRCGRQASNHRWLAVAAALIMSDTALGGRDRSGAPIAPIAPRPVCWPRGYWWRWPGPLS
jgi:4-amino-4-deoxy-L-arabinose transferase-like glycosyltransferase